MPGREVALAFGLLAAGAASAEAGRVVLKTDAAARCKRDQIGLHQPEGLKAVDWCNRDYGGKDLSLRGGRAELHEYAELGGPHDTRLATLQDVAYLDVDASDAPVYAIAAWKGKLAVRSGKQPRAASALERFQLTADGFRAR